MRKTFIRPANCGLACCFLVSALTWGQATTPSSPSNQDRYLTQLSTDKPIYRSGDAVFFRAIMLHCRTHQPLPTDSFGQLEIVGPKGNSIEQLAAPVKDGVAGFQWPVPDDASGGEYIAKFQPTTGDAPAERKFEIRAYRPPRFRSQIQFFQKGYGPTDSVSALLSTKRAEGGIPVDAQVTITARVDDIEIHRSTSKVDPNGNCLAQFNLPDAMERGEGTLAMIIEDGAVVETASKTIPILLQHVDLKLYPESGSLVGGLENRVYFEARTPSEKPADIAGTVVDEFGEQVAEFSTTHEGRGWFQFVPKESRSYFLEVKRPTGIDTQFPLPKVESDGVIIHSRANTYRSDQPISVDVISSRPGKFVIALTQRGDEVESVTADLTANNPQHVEFKADGFDGVFAVTVWNDKNVATAERLVFCEPKTSLQITAEPDLKQYVPGGKAKLVVTTTDSTGKPVSGFVGLTVTDDSVLEMIETRDHAPRLPAMVYLENDVLELADAAIYLDPNNEDASRAVDLLLGTQGWRRFATLDVKAAVAQYGDDIARALAIRNPRRARQFGAMLLRDNLLGLDLDGVAVDRFADQDVPLAAEIEEQADARGAEVKRVPEQSLFRNKQQLFEPQSQPEPGRKRRQLPTGIPAQQRGGRKNGRAVADFEVAADPALASDAAVFFLKPTLPQSALRNVMVQVREYAHRVSPSRQPNQRTDFTETLYWSAATTTDANGTATIEFDLNDSVTSFKVLADGFTQTGAIGSATTTIEAVEPFYVEPKLPLEVTSGDLLRLPLSLINATDAGLDGGHLSVRSDSWKSVQESTTSFDLQPSERARKILGIRVGDFQGTANLTLTANAGAYSDSVTRQLLVKPTGFPIQAAFGGMTKPGGTVEHSINIPEDVVDGSIVANIAVHPSPLARLTESLTGLIREPHGCFEQTSSSNYPLVMAQQYFQSHVGVDPDLILRSSQMLDTGYQKLVSFECKNKGFEWFGSDPGHDALTAYGLLEFVEMARIHKVDPELIERTKQWLLSQRDGEGGYARKAATLHTWIAEPECANSYNTWALLEAGIDVDLSTEVEWVRKAAATTKNSYVLALAANVMSKANDLDSAKALCKQLSELLNDRGSIDGATTSVVGSGGQSLEIETTSLALTAWLQYPEFTSEVEKSIKYLSESCKGGRFGSTQSTVLALRAILAYDAARTKPKVPGSLRLLVDGNQVGVPVQFGTGSQDSIVLPSVAGLLTRGKHNIAIAMSNGCELPYSVTIDYHQVKPDSSSDCKLTLDVKLTDVEIAEGNITEAKIVVTNPTPETLPTPIAIVGIPGGLEVRHDQLKELKSEGRIAAYEVIGREVVLYWRSLEPDARVEFPISLVAAVPGEYTAPASRVYQYYTDEHKQWVPGARVTIHPK
ncbi:MAG: hypothetical protein KDB27_17930 [Planctomycetales bacterium]|nr:hypothetical protein [Planctomycetales bacterium]